jgi:hypothetical protein
VAAILSLDFKWTPAAATNVELTWRKHGYTPPSEQQEYQLKWKQFKENNHETNRIIVGKGADGFRACVEILHQPALQKQIR